MTPHGNLSETLITSMAIFRTSMSTSSITDVKKTNNGIERFMCRSRADHRLTQLCTTDCFHGVKHVPCSGSAFTSAARTVQINPPRQNRSHADLIQEAT